jgi:hypothetical protein
MKSFINTTELPESYSRQLDEQVQKSEMPYGYDHDGPPADTGDYNPRKYEEKNR